MKIVIDTTNKTIELQEQVSIKDLRKCLKGLLADDFDNYKIVPKVEKETVKEYYQYYPYNPSYPYQQIYFTGGGYTNDFVNNFQITTN